MIETQRRPEYEAFPNRRRWTRDECERLTEIGFLTERYELIDGEILSKMGQNAPHASAMILLGQWLTAIFGYLFVRSEKPVVLSSDSGENNQPEPDYAITNESASAYFYQNPGPQDIRLIVEVSDTTLRLDLNTKALLYASVGVPEYWVMDINGRRLHRHRNPGQSGYGEVVISRNRKASARLTEPKLSASAICFPRRAPSQDKAEISRRQVKKSALIEWQ